jgi:hypothetical protein
MPPVPGKGSIDAAAFANSHASLSAPLAWLISAIFLPRTCNPALICSAAAASFLIHSGTLK